MPSIFRSEEMAYLELLLPSETAYTIICELGELAATQFIDLNENDAVANRKYGANLKQCADLERHLADLERAIDKENIKIRKLSGNPDVPDIYAINDLKATIFELMAKLSSSASNIDKLKEQQRNNFYTAKVLDLTLPFSLTELFNVEDETVQDDQGGEGSNNNTGRRTSSGAVTIDSMQNVVRPHRLKSTTGLAPSQVAKMSALLDSLTGIIERKKVKAFERMLFRVGRGNVFVRTMPIDEEMEDPDKMDKEDESNVKSVFITYFNSEALKTKVKQICQAFHANIYDVPAERGETRKVLMTRLEDIKAVLNQAVEQRQALLTAAAEQVKTWEVQVRKAKTVCSVMGMLNWDVTRNYLVAECWVPKTRLQDVDAAIKRANSDRKRRNTNPTLSRALSNNKDSSNANLEPGDEIAPAVIQEKTPPKKIQMPTYFQTNKFTKAYQSIVEAYAVARPGEVNPSLFTVITFPFLFSVMFGDLGHAIVMLCFAVWLIVKEESLKKVAANNESFRMIFGGRYVILLMGIFSIYAGIMYNDIFCKSYHILATQWYSNFTDDQIRSASTTALDPFEMRNLRSRWPHPIGMDPIWDMSVNRLTMQNSVKMKLSVIFGVFHMIFGVCISIINHFHFKEYINIFCEYIPQMLFICFLFLYMDALIVFKWIYFDASTSGEAPSVLIGMIDMVLFKYSEDSPPEIFITKNLMQLQYALVVIALVSIPWMLVVKPVYLQQMAKKRAKNRQQKKKPSPPSRSQSAGVKESAVELTEVVVSNAIEPAQSTSEKSEKRESEAPSIDLSAILPSTSSDDGLGSSSQENGSKDLAEDDDGDDEEKFDFGEVFIHQAIHTIEYVLGLISHTASYLRLWALNLAHSELSTVLWNMVFRLAFSNSTGGYGGIIALVIIFIPWSVLTVAILCIMEGVSAFLHALRLHWVEFQSKFYVGGGVLFRPLNFKDAF